MGEPTGQETCDRCGLERLDRRRIGAARRAGRWLTHGRPVPDTEVRCRSCGHVSSRSGGSTATLLYAGHPSAWRLPRRLLDVVLRERTWQPNPALYLGAAAVGTAAGVAVDAVTDVPWWTGTLAGPAVVFAFSAVGAVRNPWRDHPLRVEFLSVLAPRCYLALIEAEEEARLRAADLPLYGLPTEEEWFRFAGGTTRQGNEVVAAELGHRASIDAELPDVRIETHRGRLTLAEVAPERDPAVREHEEGANRDALLHWLAHTVAAIGPPPDGEDPRRWHERYRQQSEHLTRALRGRRWQTRRFPVDERPEDFAVLAEGDAWVATARISDHHVNIRAHGVDHSQIRLVRSHVLELYLQGRRELRARHRHQGD